MRYILILLLFISGAASAQFAPTSAKTAFKWGVSIGTRDSSAYAANDSLVVTINRQGRMMYRSTDGYWKLLANAASSDYVPYVGAVTNVNLGNFRLTARSLRTDSIYSNSSAGMYLLTNGGAAVAHWGGGGSIEVDFKGFAGYDANRSASYTARSFTDKNYVDSADALRVRYTDTAAMLSGYKTYYPRTAISLTTTGTSGAATYNNSTGVLNIPQYSPDLSGYVPTSRTLTINGTAFDLSANRSWSVGTVTAVTASAPLSSSGGTTPNITISQANTSTNGFLSSTDWNTFNNKQNAITLTTTGSSGAATLVGSTLNIPNYGSALSGYVDLTTNQSIGGIKTFTTAVDAAQLRFSESGGFGQRSGYTQIGGTADYFNFINGNNTRQAQFNYATTGSGRVYTLPSESGTLALTSALSGYLPLTGGTLTGALSGTTAVFSSTGSFGNSVTISSSTGSGVLTNTSGVANAGLTISVDGSTASDRNIMFKNGSSETMRLTNSGNLGLGVTPSAWNDGFVGFEIKNSANNLSANGGSYFEISQNATWNSGWKYVNTAAATRYEQGAGVHAWFNAGSGTAGNAITFTQAMTLGANGNLLLGTTTDNGTDRLQVAGSVYSSGILNIGKSQSGNAALTVKSPAGGNTGIILIEGDRPNDGWGLYSVTSDNFIITRFTDGSFSDLFTMTPTGAATFSSTVTATGFIVSSSRTLKDIYSRSKQADGIDFVGYTWKKKLKLDSKKHLGFIAEEVEKVLPDAVFANEKGVKSVNYTEVLIYKLDNLSEKIKELELKIEKLEKKYKKAKK